MKSNIFIEGFLLKDFNSYSYPSDLILLKNNYYYITIHSNTFFLLTKVVISYLILLQNIVRYIIKLCYLTQFRIITKN